jgi:S1-C subfamily serine protease
VIGVNAQIESDTGGNVGLGFAIPSETVREVASELIADGEVEHAYLGVQITSLPAAVSQELGGPERPTVEVTRVVEAGPAARAGLRGADDTVTVDGEEYPAGGDLIVEVGGEPVQTAADLQAAISSRQPGTEVELTIVRDGSEQTLTVELGEQPETSS